MDEAWPGTVALPVQGKQTSLGLALLLRRSSRASTILRLAQSRASVSDGYFIMDGCFSAQGCLC